jgi:hypothetical protein
VQDYARDDPKLRQQSEAKHQADQQVPEGKDVCGVFGQTTVEQRTGQKDDSGGDGDPMQFAQRASNNIASEMRIGQNARSKHSRRQNECEENQTADPGDEREQHEEAEEGHHVENYSLAVRSKELTAEDAKDHAENAEESRTDNGCW